MRRQGTYDNQMVTVDTRWDGRCWQSAAHKLQQSHLRTSILHGHAVGLQFQVCLTSDVSSAIRVTQERLFRVLKMRVENFLGQCQLARGAEYAPYFLKAGEQFGIWRGARGDIDIASRRRVVSCS